MQTARERTLQKRVIIPFDKHWRFSKGDHDGAKEPAFDDRNWRVLNVPHDWSIEEPFDPEMENGGMQGYLPRRAVGWYRKTFRLDPSIRGKRIAVQFDGVHHNSDVWINGRHLGRRPYGYVSFQYDLTPYLIEDGDNVLAVRVDNTSPLFDRWYSGSGIYRHVWLIATDPVHVVPWGIGVTTSDVSRDRATVHIRTEVINRHEQDRDVEIVTQIVDEAGTLVAEGKTAMRLAAGEQGAAEETLQVTRPKLWSPDSPALCQVHTFVYANGELADDTITTIGIRSVVFNNDLGLLLNGKPIKLKGVCLHHDLGCLGAAFHEQAMERRLRVLKELGCNAIRFSHNPMAPEFLDLCDRMGFLVIDEAFDKWTSLSYEPMFEEWWRADLAAMVLRDRNHPSVIIWSVGNEVERQGSPEMLDRLGMLADYCRELDPTRPVTCAFDPHNWPRSLFHGPIEEKVKVMRKLAEKVDILALNYQEQWVEDYRKAIPDKLIVGSESFPFFRGKGNILKAFEPMNPWLDVEKHDYVVGAFVWPGIDYLGETSWPYKGWNAGLIDTCGFRKPISYLQESFWSDKPMVHIAVFDDTVNQSIPSRWMAHWTWPKMTSSWTLPHCENQLVRLVTFTNCETVELIVNGESLGEKRLADFPDRLMTWYVPYAPGTIEAIGRMNGLICAVHRLQTAGEARRVVLTPDRSRMRANGTDIAHVEVQIADESGILVPHAEIKVQFELIGEGTIIGVDNGNLASSESYKGTCRTTYNGKCLVIVQATEQPGTLELRAGAEGLTGDTVTLHTF